MTYTGERVQVDVKYVPAKSLTKEVKEKDGRYYQYTAIDEYIRHVECVSVLNLRKTV